MKVTRHTQRLFRLQQAVFYALLIAVVILLAKVSVETNKQFDWTANARHTLSDTSRELLSGIDNTIQIQVFISPDDQYHAAVIELLERYQRHTDKLNISYIDPAFSPDLVRSLNIQQQGEMVVSQGKQQQHVFDLSEQSLTNALITVSRQKQQWLVFIEGHGERSLFEQTNFSLSTWAQQLQSQGFQLHAHNLTQSPTLPENTAVLVIASPTRNWLPGEVDIVKDYLEKGGNLLWLAEPDQTDSLAALSESLGIEFIDGTVMDPNTAMLGIDDPRFVLISDYANHPVGVATASVSLMVEATAIQQTNPDNSVGWQYLNLLNSQPDAWVESNALTPDNLSMQRYDAGADVSGPFSLGYVMTRTSDTDQPPQRIALIGDGDFVSDAYIGNAANLDLAMALVNWLSNDDKLITIPVKTSVGTQLSLTKTQSIILGLGFLVMFPLLLLVTGLGIWWRRRRR
ncbi:GldG family protein [Methylophaga sp.]|uniref:GldG family protein n=1 Tax=Methylophaga sp. TaxID=2024840 RepID=UPI003F69511F